MISKAAGKSVSRRVSRQFSGRSASVQPEASTEEGTQHAQTTASKSPLVIDFRHRALTNLACMLGAIEGATITMTTSLFISMPLAPGGVGASPVPWERALLLWAISIAFEQLMPEVTPYSFATNLLTRPDHDFWFGTPLLALTTEPSPRRAALQSLIALASQYFARHSTRTFKFGNMMEAMRADFGVENVAVIVCVVTVSVVWVHGSFIYSCTFGRARYSAS